VAQITPTQTYLNILQEANLADSLGTTVLVHTETLLPIKLSESVVLSSCQSVAIVQGCAHGGKVTATWLIPLHHIRGVEIRDAWLPDEAGQIAKRIGRSAL
jgi:hypothetical protein